MKRNAVLGALAALTLVLGASAQLLSPQKEAKSVTGKRQVEIVTLARNGFEPPLVAFRPGSFTLLIRDLAGSFNAKVELRRGNRKSAVLESAERAASRPLMSEMQFDLTPGEYYLRVADSLDRQLKIIVGEK